ncbi:MAG: RNA polymerase sigma-70 factor (ECF subfamily) [Verrucomicrobiales bacterium]
MQTLADDNELIRASQNGDMASLEILLDRHHDRLRAVCAKVVGRGADADDAAQMALISIVKNLEKFDGRAQFSTWSYRIATNAAIDELRRRDRRAADSIDDDDRHVQVATVGNIDEATSARIVVNDALDRLAEEFRLPVILRDLCGLDYDQIAEVLELAPGTVRSRIARGRGKLANIIGSVSGDDVTDDGNQLEARGVQGHDDE